MITDIQPQPANLDLSISGLESEVRNYSRLFPTVFATARGAWLWDTKDAAFLDFFSGSGSLNYGHNDPMMKKYVLKYIEEDGIVNSLDQLTEAKLFFMKQFNDHILRPRNFVYKFQFCGPTGTNAIEAAIKLARKYTGREMIVYFEHSFHGMSYGSLSVSGTKNKRLAEAYKKNVIGMPFGDIPSHIAELQHYLAAASRDTLPAAILLETIQAEGGIRVAAPEWLEQVAQLATRYGVLLIVDDIQAGCGRTGNFFSFDHTGIRPDIICLSKSLSGYGFPFSMNLLNPAIDCWEPGEHNGTFRGNNLAFIAGGHTLDYWKDGQLSQQILSSARLIEEFFASSATLKDRFVRGTGLIRGFEMDTPEEADKLQKMLFRNGLLMDLCGPADPVLKIMPPLTIGRDDLVKGLAIIERSLFELRSNN